jgi:DNA-binding transcriptional LysR family regulator
MEWSERIGRRIRLRDLHILLAVVQAKSMAKAAEHLAISKPVVSKAIADLEHVLGVRVLERDRRGAEPTIYGAALLKRGLIVFDELREGVKDIELLADPSAGEARVGSVTPLAASFVSAVIDRLSRRYARMTFKLVTGETDMLHRELGERNVDVLIARRLNSAADERASFEFLFDDPYVVVAGRHHAWARRRKIELAELMSGLWVLPPPDSPLGSIITGAFRASGLDYPRVTVGAITPDVRASLLETGRFLTIFSTSALRFSTRRSELKVLPVELPSARASIGIVTLGNRTLSPVARLFIEHAREVAKPLARKAC